MSEQESCPQSEDLDHTLDPAVTPKLFRRWRAPRFGRSNPERMNNAVWEWLVKSRLNAYQATQRLHGPSALDAGPGWCFDRFGQSSTQLPDGRLVLIAGEHEDCYDPDFYIYNDVVVRHPDGCLDIFGYPRDVFPPTDFHSATLVGNRIVVIGNLGYPEDRRPGTTPVLVLDLECFAITVVQDSGALPGWIHGHSAVLSEDGRSILVQRGKLDRGGEDTSLVENIDDWRLHLADWRWERLTDRRWQRWQVRRKDGEGNHLFAYQQAVWEREFEGMKGFADKLAELTEQFDIPSLEEELGVRPDLQLFKQLYKPGLAFGALPKREDEFGVHRIRMDGVVVRYVEDMASIQVTVEGDLPQTYVQILTSDLVAKMSALENTPCELKQL